MLKERRKANWGFEFGWLGKGGGVLLAKRKQRFWENKWFGGAVKWVGWCCAHTSRNWLVLETHWKACCERAKARLRMKTVHSQVPGGHRTKKHGKPLVQMGRGSEPEKIIRIREYMGFQVGSEWILVSQVFLIVSPFWTLGMDIKNSPFGDC